MCGIVGIAGNKDVIRGIAHGLYDLQHRGEQAVGVVVFDGRNLKEHKRKGLVTETFNEENEQELFKQLSGKSGIGHVLYSTVGGENEEKQSKTLQPLIGRFHNQPFAVAHNGNLIEIEELRKEAKSKGYNFQSEVSDTEVIVALLSTSLEEDFLEALKRVLPRLKGSFSLVILFKDKVIGARDKFGIRPICLGWKDGSFILASEDCAFHTMGGRFVREILPGEIIILSKEGIENSFIWAEKPQCRFCILEYIYFARPDSEFCGQSVYSYRKKAGESVAKEHQVPADIVCAVPESGEIYNYSIAHILGIETDKGIFRNRYYSKRTFLTSRETDRRELQRIKLYVLRKVVHGQRVVLAEDSVIRASVATEVVAMMREAGAIEVHLRIGSSLIRFPCFLGIDMPTRGELIAASFTEDEIGKKIIQADSIGYLSLEGMIEATGLPRENLCLGCFTGEYPVKPPKPSN